MKKVELHVHIDGSVRPETISEILNISVEEAKEKTIVKEENKDLKEYLTKFELPIKVMQTKENLTRISKEMVEDLKKDDVIYAEVRFGPYYHQKEGLTMDEIVESVLEGINQVEGIKTNLLLCMKRELGFKENLEVINCAKRFLNKGVVGIDLAGDEKHYKTENFEELFKIAKEEKIPFTIHSGEADGPESIKSSIKFGTTRLGHGIRVLEDAETLKIVKEKGITLEICPTSNIQTNVIESFEKYPLRKLIEAGLKITINTDNRILSNTNLEKEYNIIKKYCNITDEEIKQFNINAIEASFISQEEKEKYIKIIKENK